MQYASLGRHPDVQVSRLGLGGHREGVEVLDGIARTATFFLPAEGRAAVVGAAIDSGVTYFDSTFGCELASMGESFRILGVRDGLFVNGMRVDFFANLLADELDARAYTRREVEGRLRDFGFDQIDQFLLGALDSGDPLSGELDLMRAALDELLTMKAEGKLRFVGFSCHDPDYAARLIEAFPDAFDTVMTPYNFINRTAEGKLADVLMTTNTAWVAMKPLVWRAYGLPVTVLRNLRPVPGRLELDPEVPIGELAIRSILANPLITSTVPAMSTVQAVAENLRAIDGELTGSDMAHLAAYASVMDAEDLVPLAIGGLLEDNLRVRACGLGTIARALGLTLPAIDYAEPDAEAQAAAVAGQVINDLRNDPEWDTIIP